MEKRRKYNFMFYDICTVVDRAHFENGITITKFLIAKILGSWSTLTYSNYITVKMCFVQQTDLIFVTSRRNIWEGIGGTPTIQHLYLANKTASRWETEPTFPTPHLWDGRKVFAISLSILHFTLYFAGV